MPRITVNNLSRRPVAADSAAEPDRFQTDSLAVLQRVRAAVTRVITEAQGPIDRAADLERSLGLHKTLAWKLARIAEAVDPATIYRHLPGDGALRKLLRAAEGRGVGPEIRRAVPEAIEELERFILMHAGDRESFEMMLNRTGTEGREETDILYRKAGFNCASYTWGAQARAQMKALFCAPGRDDPGLIDCTTVTGFVDLRRIHPDKPWIVSRERPTDDRGAPKRAERRPLEPMPASANPSGYPMLAEFCSQPLPTIQRRVLESGAVQDELVPGPVGQAGAVTCFTAEMLSSVMSRTPTEEDAAMAQALEVRTPCRFGLLDHFVHVDLFDEVKPRLQVFGQLSGMPWWDLHHRQFDELEALERVQLMGFGPAAAHLAEIPRYEELIRHVCERCGWRAEEFRLYRVRMAYPIVPSAIIISYPLPVG